LMAWFSGPLTVQNGKATVEVPVPDFNGEIRLMAVVWSAEAVGQAEAKVLVRDPVVTIVTAPRFLAPGDSAQVTLALTHASGPAGEVGLAVTGEGVNLNPGALPASVTLAEGGTQRVTLPLRAGEDTGTGTLHLTVTTPDGRALSKDIAVPVMMGEPEQARKTRVTLAAGQSMRLDPALTQGFLPGAQVVMASGGFGMLDVAGALAALDRYPYGCTEQTTSRALPLLYLSDLSVLLSATSEPEVAARIDESLAKVLTRQSASGAFGMWSPGAGDLWLDAYVTDFLSRARAAGHTVPEQSFKTAVTNLQNRVNYAPEPQYADPYENAALAYAVSVLARERAATVGDLRYYADTAAEAFKTPMAAAQIGAALASYGDQARADRMFARAQNLLGDDVTISEGQVWRSDYGSSLRDRAAVLAIAAEAGSNAVDLQTQTLRLADQIDRRNRNGWGLSTQEMLWTVLAAQALSHDPGAVTVNGAAISRAVADLPAGAAIANTGSRDVELTLTAFGYPAGAVEKGGRGYTITRSYYTHDGTRVDPATVTLGTRMVAVIEVTPLEGGAGRVIVNDPLPAGFEIDNPNLIRAGDIAALDWLDAETETESVEFRQDRFIAALNRMDNTPFRLAYMLRAVTQGDFRHPAASVEDMYRPEYRAWTDGGRVTVAPEG
ncbi:MAG: alpha-2-macroglobulin family protein, partial [Paracoccus sp. (in: a-proteobacteria)]|nr:alpha-2-macroglobulin family protein [Paracoccus sp. (in: a-proteobacteria)]